MDKRVHGWLLFFFFSSHGMGLGVFGRCRKVWRELLYLVVFFFLFVCLEMHFMVGERCCWLRP